MFYLFNKLVAKSIYFGKKLFSSFKYNCIKWFNSKPDVVIAFGHSLGDDLLCTIVARQLKVEGYKKIWMKTHYPEIFKYNPDFKKVIKKQDFHNASPEMERFLSSTNLILPVYTTYNRSIDRDIIPNKHIVHIMCDIAEVKYPEVMKPYFYLTEKEKAAGKLFDKQICIQSTGKSSKHHMKNKEWFPERFAEVTVALKGRYKIIQLGMTDDELLPNVIDMRGKTSIRQSAAILFNSSFFIGLVGFLMHLSRAVDCKSIIVYGGRESPLQSGYNFNVNMYSKVHCSPCWLWNTCDYGRMCMKNIVSSDIVNATSLLNMQ